MANKLRAIKEYCPTVVQNRHIDVQELAEYIAGRCSMAASDVRHVLEELRNGVAYYCATGASVKLDGLGTYTPGVNLDGSFHVNHRADRFLTSRLNLPGGFRGAVRNREYMGKDVEELFALWNEAHPEDPIT